MCQLKKTQFNCTAQKLYLINNDSCNNACPYNSFECGYDGGGCFCTLNAHNVLGINPYEIGDGVLCHEYLDKKECGYHGSDCIIIPEHPVCRRDGVKTEVGYDICLKTYTNANPSTRKWKALLFSIHSLLTCKNTTNVKECIELLNKIERNCYPILVSWRESEMCESERKKRDQRHVIDPRALESSHDSNNGYRR